MRKKNIFWGVLLLLIAALIVVNQLGFLLGIGIVKLVITIVLIAIIVKNVRYMNFPGILFPAAFLCILYDHFLGITALSPWTLLFTALLASIGLSMIFKNGNNWHHNWDGKWDHNWDNKWDKKWNQKWDQKWNQNSNSNFDNVINQPDDKVVNCIVNFSSSVKYVNSDNFERANLKCSFGALKAYFDNAIIQNGSAEIFLDVSFAGVELYLPKTWKIIEDVNVSLGAMEEKNRNMPSDSPVVTIKGNVSFGGVDIIYI